MKKRKIFKNGKIKKTIYVKKKDYKLFDKMMKKFNYFYTIFISMWFPTNLFR